MTQQPPGPPYDQGQPGPSGQQPYGGQPYGGQQGQPYGSQAYGSQPYGGHGGHGGSQRKGLAIAALVLGALALLTCWTIVGGIVLGVAALVVGLVALGRARKSTGGGKGLAIAGIVLGVLGAVLSGALLAFGLSFLGSEEAQDLQECLQQAGDDQAAVEQCQRDFEGDLQDRFSQ
ncbi:DUF4190 domain-containing protein [Nocardioides perillae]|uniref:DUF4190 domain-containing protein n=1 Tax=Nocardioides perillae TaxID=1119534 RepID=A0A7Y9UV02_9ACTN|nr:hypothetical protein [Nocardioides perillae]